MRVPLDTRKAKGRVSPEKRKSLDDGPSELHEMATRGLDIPSPHQGALSVPEILRRWPHLALSRRLILKIRTRSKQRSSKNKCFEDSGRAPVSFGNTSSNSYTSNLNGHTAALFDHPKTATSRCSAIVL